MGTSLKPAARRTARPLSRTVVGIDFSDRSRQALERAVQLTRAQGGRIDLVHVLAKRTGAPPNRAAGARLQEWRDRAAEGAPSTTFGTVLASGQPFVELIRAARDRDAELIVVGRHGARRLAESVIGTTAARVIRKGDRPALVVNQPGETAYRRPLIAADLEASPARVFELVRRISPDARIVRVVHAYHVPFDGLIPPGDAEDPKSLRHERRDQATQQLEALVRGFDWPGTTIKPVVREGEPRQAVTAELLRCRADLLALGTHARAGLSHALIGSVAEWLLGVAPCDVLIARPPRFRFELP